MNDTWTATMDAITELASYEGIEFHELRNAWGAREVARDPEFFKDQGVTASDMNHMLFGAWRTEQLEVRQLAHDLGERKRIVNRVAEQTGQHPTLVLQQLRELFAPAPEVDA